MTSGSCLWSLMIILALVAFVPRSYAFWLAWVAYACLVGCVSSIDKTLCSLLYGESTFFVEFGVWFDCLCLRGSLWFALATGRVLSFVIEKPWVWLLPSWVGNWCLSSIWLGLRGSWCFGVYIVYFVFLLYFLHTHVRHFASHVILTCIYLIMLIIVLGWVVMRCDLFC
jgi:hypothetical protein